MIPAGPLLPSLLAVLDVHLNLITPAENGVRKEGEQTAPRGGDGRTLAEGEFPAMPPVLKVSFHFLPLLGLIPLDVGPTEAPITGEKAALQGRKEFAQGHRVASTSWALP